MCQSVCFSVFLTLPFDFESIFEKKDCLHFENYLSDFDTILHVDVI